MNETVSEHVEAGGSEPPPWMSRLVREGIWRAILAVLLALAALWLLDAERELVRFLLTAGLVALALEPGVTSLHLRYGLRRGSATAVLLIGMLLGVIAFATGMGVVLAREADQVVQQLPAYIDQLNGFTQDRFGTTVISATQRDEAEAAATHIKEYLQQHSKDILGGALSLLGGIFSMFTIGLFAFYFTADGPKMRRVLLSRLRPERQARVLFAWETAIQKVGGYLYSRLLLAAINGAFMFVTLKVVRVPFALPLALFSGVVAAFIPIVGTYVAGAFPLLVALAERGATAAMVVVAEILLYQLVENYFLSPRISAKTIELNAGVAFGAAMAGGAVGGFLGAFFALPIAATIQAFLSTYSTTYDVADSALTGAELADRRGWAGPSRRRRSEAE